ncbi:MAG: hypothetical protein M3Z22_07970 [Verrucomicrobiota bacterium]|nr:hypothetical protein [Verrucomicrobiota bacterium]
MSHRNRGATVQRSVKRVAVVMFTLLLFGISPVTALAHDAPDDGGAQWLMADWMLLAFLAFFGAALLAFLVAFKRGLFYNLEAAKYHILTIDEPDYYTPAWAKEEMDDPERP